MLKFPEIEEFTDSSATKSREELQKIYFKNHNKKRQLQQISTYNKNVQNPKSNPQQQNNQNKQFLQVNHLLNEQQVCFKTLPKHMTHISSIGHVFTSICALMLAKQSLILCTLGLFLQIIVITFNALHYKKQVNYLHIDSRSKFIKIQMILIGCGDFITILIFIKNTLLFGVILMSLIDCVFVKKLYKIYCTQKQMDIKFPDFQLQPSQAIFQSEVI